MFSNLSTIRIQKVAFVILCAMCVWTIGSSFRTVYSQQVEEHNFAAGEKMVYKIYYNWNFVWLSAGEVTFEIKDEGDVYHLEATGRTYSSYEWFFKVRDKFHSYVDKKTLLPKLFIRDIHEGGYRRYEKIVFDQANGKATLYWGKKRDKLETKEIQFNGPMHDVLSIVYHLRNVSHEELQRKGQIPMNIALSDDIYNLNLKFEADINNLDVKDKGSFKAIRCSPDLVSGSTFKKGNEMKVFIGKDKNNVPVLIESPISIGSVKVVPKEFKGLKFPLDSKI